MISVPTMQTLPRVTSAASNPTLSDIRVILRASPNRPGYAGRPTIRQPGKEFGNARSVSTEGGASTLHCGAHSHCGSDVPSSHTRPATHRPDGRHRRAVVHDDRTDLHRSRRCDAGRAVWV